MKILGIHGRNSIPSRKGSTWEKRISDITSRWHTIDLPQFDSSEDPTYESWAQDIKKLDVASYDAIITSSHGSWVFARYVKEHGLYLKRVVFCCPGRWSTDRVNTGKLYDYLEQGDMNLEKNIDQIYIVHSTDDQEVFYSEWVKFQKQIWWELVAVSWVSHKLDGPVISIISNLAITWNIAKK